MKAFDKLKLSFSTLNIFSSLNFIYSINNQYHHNSPIPSTSIHRPDPNSSTPDVRVAFSKVFRQGFEELVLPVQECKLGESTIPAMVKREMEKHNRLIYIILDIIQVSFNLTFIILPLLAFPIKIDSYICILCRHEVKKASKIAELKKADEEKAAEEAKKKMEELNAATEVDITTEEMPSNDDIMIKIAGVDVVQREGIQVEEADKPKSYSDMEVSEDEEDSFQFERENLFNWFYL